MRWDEDALLGQLIYNDEDSSKSIRGRKLSIKSMEMEFHRHSGIGRGWSNPSGL